jgi:putative membrane protein
VIIEVLVQALTDAAAVLLAMGIVPSLHPPDGALATVGVALLFAVLRLVLRPVVALLTFPVVLIFTGPSIVLFNALILWLCSWISVAAGLNFRGGGVMAFLLGAVIVMVMRVVATQSIQVLPRRRGLEKERAQLQHLEHVRDWMQGERDRFKRAAEERRRIT